MNDEHWMQQGLDLALLGEGYVEPNPMVGCVIVSEGKVIGSGYHQRFGEAHAEVNAVQQTGRSSLAGCTVYVTLEPCCHHGKTPPCSDLLCRMKPDRVVVGTLDPFAKVNGGGIAQLREAGIQVEVGVLDAKCKALIAPFTKRISISMPFVIAKWAMSLDGKIATSSGDSRWISCEASRQRVHQWRGKMDAIVVGIGTALADDPMLTARPVGPRTAIRVVLDSRCRLSPTSKLASTAKEVPVLVWTSENADQERRKHLEEMGCEVVVCKESDPLVSTGKCLEYLATKNATNVFVEGGGGVLGNFIDAELVDEVRIFTAPVILGGSDSPSPVRGVGASTMKLASRISQGEWEVVDSDSLFTGRLIKTANLGRV